VTLNTIFSILPAPITQTSLTPKDPSSNLVKFPKKNSIPIQQLKEIYVPQRVDMTIRIRYLWSWDCLKGFQPCMCPNHDVYVYIGMDGQRWQAMKTKVMFNLFDVLILSQWLERNLKKIKHVNTSSNNYVERYYNPPSINVNSLYLLTKLYSYCWLKC